MKTRKTALKLTVLALTTLGLALASTTAFAAKDDEAGYPWRPFDDRCVAEDVCV